MEREYTGYANAKIDQAAYIGAAAQQTRPMGSTALQSESELEAIVSRLQRLTAEINEVGHKLANHADRVFGEQSEGSTGSACGPIRSGLIGSIHDALDQLERSHSFVATEAGRNCTLA